MRIAGRRYDALQLVEREVSLLASGGEAEALLICDLDKTYLETAFESLLDLARVAVQGPQDKVAVTGAADCLRAFKFPASTGEARAQVRQLHFISSSPPQLRRVITEKLQIDGLHWDSLTLKNQMYNLTQGRPERLRDHVSYKLLAIGQALSGARAGCSVSLIGDFAEYDPFVYGLIAYFLTEKPASDSLRRILVSAHVDADAADTVATIYASLPELRIENVFIRVLGNYRSVFLMPFAGQLWAFDHFHQVAAKLYLDGYLGRTDFISLLGGTRPGLTSPVHCSRAMILENLLANGVGLEDFVLLRGVLDELGAYHPRSEAEPLTAAQASVCNLYPPRRFVSAARSVTDQGAEAIAADYYRRLSIKRHRRDRF